MAEPERRHPVVKEFVRTPAARAAAYEWLAAREPGSLVPVLTREQYLNTRDDRDSPSLRAWRRLAYAVAVPLVRIRARPLMITVVGLLASLAVPLVVSGAPLAAAGLVLLSALAAAVGGTLAEIGARSSRIGAVYGAVADRIAEACWLAALWRLGAPAWVPATGWVVCWLHEYVRARAALAGMPQAAASTVAERPTRVVVAVLGLALAGILAPLDRELIAGTATAAGAIFTLLALTGLVQLLVVVRQALRYAVRRA
jgi:CDP-diacylglycerol--glycerol-3-phosphate 3-phosphatidyltransferase